MSDAAAAESSAVPQKTIIRHAKARSAIVSFLDTFGPGLEYEIRDREPIERCTVVAINPLDPGVAEKIMRWCMVPDLDFELIPPVIETGGGQFGHTVPVIALAQLRREFRPGFPGNRITIAIAPGQRPSYLIGLMR